MKKIYIKTYGCQMNERDSEYIVQLLCYEFDMEVTEEPFQADVLIFLSCSVREKAQEKLFSDIGRVKGFKKEKKCVIAVGGCVAAQEKEKIFSRAPYVDLVFGPRDLSELPAMISELDRKKRVIQVDIGKKNKFDGLPYSSLNRISANVSIMEGCDNYCSYCIVPMVRGNEASRDFDEIIKECKFLCDRGTREIHFLGQNVNHYMGYSKKKLQMMSFSDLLFEVSEIEGVLRIKFTTSNPKYFNDSLIDVFKNINKVVSHIHLPIQSGSDRVLSMMRRGYTVKKYLAIVEKLKKARRDISISSDFIVGFPSETERDFQQTLEIVENVKFDTSFSFMYSPRPGTIASKLNDDVSAKDKKNRLHILQNLINELSQEISKNMIGRYKKVLVLGRSGKNQTQLFGITDNNRNVVFSGEKKLIGEMIYVRIDSLGTNFLKGSIENYGC